MYYFDYKENDFYCEDISIEQLCKEFPTPFYVYSHRTLTEHFDKLNKAFSSLDALICYSMKANSNLSLVKILSDRGSGVDVVSGGELFRAMQLNIDPGKIVYAGVGKTSREISEAINYGIRLFNIESVSELKRVNSIASSMNKKASVALRFNPDVDVDTHDYITTGKKETKFGMDRSTILDMFSKKEEFPNIDLKGLHIHIGSQILKSDPFKTAIKKAAVIITELRKLEHNIDVLDIGGGLGVEYTDTDSPMTADDFVACIGDSLKDLDVKIILEPGRFIVANAGLLVSKVVYVKESPSKNFAIVDAGMNTFIRPSLYGGYHRIKPVKKDDSRKSKLYDIVGPICESGDFLAKNRELAQLEEGEVLALMGAGAYGFSMASHYNSHPLPFEILVEKDKFFVIRKGEDYNDLIRDEKEFIFQGGS